jgi:tRNA(Arg) A34 adenosine deaminase TadA
MVDIAGLAPAKHDARFLRRSFDVARRSMHNGNHPFGAILVDKNGNVLIECENGYMPEHDGTAHAERLLATEACRALAAEVGASATIYSSAEGAMCVGAIYWAGIGRLVYGLSEHRLRTLTGNHPENSTCPAAPYSRAAAVPLKWSARSWKMRRLRCTKACGRGNSPGPQLPQRRVDR